MCDNGPIFTWMNVASSTQLISCCRMTLFWGLLKQAAMREGKSTLMRRGWLKYWKGSWHSFCSTLGWRPDCTITWKTQGAEPVTKPVNGTAGCKSLPCAPPTCKSATKTTHKQPLGEDLGGTASHYTIIGYKTQWWDVLFLLCTNGNSRAAVT